MFDSKQQILSGTWRKKWDLLSMQLAKLFLGVKVNISILNPQFSRLCQLNRKVLAQATGLPMSLSCRRAINLLNHFSSASAFSMNNYSKREKANITVRQQVGPDATWHKSLWWTTPRAAVCTAQPLKATSLLTHQLRVSAQQLGSKGTTWTLFHRLWVHLWETPTTSLQRDSKWY